MTFLLQNHPSNASFQLDHFQEGFKTHAAMSKSLFVYLPILSLLAGCAATPQPAQRQPASTTAPSAAVADVNTAPAASDDGYETVFVPPPTGSLLGGGSVRVPKRAVTGTDETALISHIRHLNAAAGSKDERPYVMAAVSKATGVSERELQAQQDMLRLRFGELCAINAIARVNSNKVGEIAALKSKGKTWTDLAKSNGVNIASVVQTARNASELTTSQYSSAAERARGGHEKWKEMGVKMQPNVSPGN